jgi:hypothetical protein
LSFSLGFLRMSSGCLCVFSWFCEVFPLVFHTISLCVCS